MHTLTVLHWHRRGVRAHRAVRLIFRPSPPGNVILIACSCQLQRERGSAMDHVLSVPLRLCVELERRFVKSPELSEGTLERSGLGHPIRSRTGEGELTGIAQEEVECAFCCGAFGSSAGASTSGREGEGGTSRAKLPPPTGCHRQAAAAALSAAAAKLPPPSCRSRCLPPDDDNDRRRHDHPHPPSPVVTPQPPARRRCRRRSRRCRRRCRRRCPRRHRRRRR